MSPPMTQYWVAPHAEDTHAVGVRLGQCALRGDFITCNGTLGAGKTTFVQGLAEGMGVGTEEYVRSPTFALIHEYQGRIPLYHFDFYRLSCASEVQALGFDEYLEAGGVIVVEWAKKFPDLLPAARLDVTLYVTVHESRHIQCTTSTPTYHRYFEQICAL